MILWNSSAVSGALEELASASPAIQEAFTELLNDYHGNPGRSFEYWDRVAGDWLIDFTHGAYAAYREALLQAVPPVQPLSISVFSDPGAYQNAVINDPLVTAELQWRIAASLASFPGASASAFSRSVVTVGSGSQDPGGFRNRIYDSGRRAIGSPAAPLVMCKPYHKCGRPNWMRALWKWRKWVRQDNFSYPVAVSATLDHEWRLKRSADTAVTSFVDVMRMLLPLYVPTIFLEGFAAYRRGALALGLSRPEVLYTANALHGHTLFKLLAAEWAEDGTRILCHQHGGGYGTEKRHVSEEYETRVSDRFFTLGWCDQPQKQAPLPGTAIGSPGGRAACSESRILLCSTIYSRNVIRFHYQPLPGTVERMLAQTILFVEQLSPAGNLTVRLHPYDWGWNFAATLARRVPTLRLDDHSRSGTSAFAGSALVVHNYLGTSWLETLAMDVPTVCFYDPDTYLFREPAQPYIERLESVGILHRSGLAAARHVAEIASDPAGWWRSSDVRASRDAFVGRYANFSPDWVRQWEAEFRSWIA